MLRGGASDAESMPSYLLFLEALGGYIRTASHEQLRAEAGSMAPVLATILPELTVALGDAPMPFTYGDLGGGTVFIASAGPIGYASAVFISTADAMNTVPTSVLSI